MDIFKEAKKEHDEFRATIKRLLDTTSRAVKTRSETFSEFNIEVTAHHEAEESVLVPVLKTKKETKEGGLEIVEEHDVLRFLLDKLATVPVDDERWSVILTVFQETIEHHMQEEEGEIQDKARKTFDQAKLDSMGKAFVEEDERLEKAMNSK